MLKTRFWLSTLIGIAFIAPLGAVIAVEHAKNNAKLAEAQKEYAATLAETNASRERYFKNIETRKAELQKIMTDAQAQYNDLLKKQPDLIAQHQTTKTQTVTQPVTVQQSVPVTATKPASTRKTKTS